MSDNQRNKIRRAYWQGMSVERIAIAVGRNVRHVEAALFTRIRAVKV